VYLFHSPVFCYSFLGQCSKGFLSVPLLWVYFTLVHSTPSIALLYPFTSHPPFFNSFQYTSLCPLPSQMWCFMILLMFYHSFPFPLSPSSIEWFHCYKRVLHLSLYTIMFVFMYTFICWICLPRMRENMWLTSLNMMCSNYIHLPSNSVSLFLMAE
jgi:hypothetical protein